MFKCIFFPNRIHYVVKIFSVTMWHVSVGEVSIESCYVNLQKKGTWKT
jgi:hypothetical protein